MPATEQRKNISWREPVAPIDIQHTIHSIKLKIRKISQYCMDATTQLKSNTLPLAFLYVKANPLTPSNVIHGLEKSEEITVGIASTLHALALTKRGCCFRLNEYGFLLVVPLSEHTEEELNLISQDVHISLNNGFMGHSFLNTIGASIYPLHSINIKQLIRFSMVSAYCSELHCKPFTLYHKNLDKAVQRKNELVCELSNQLSESKNSNDITINYQPKQSIQDGSLIGFEALCRWKHPKLGYISPSEFIPLIENTHLMNKLTRMVLRKAVSEASCMVKKKNVLPIAVNVSAGDLLSLDLFDYIQGLAGEFNVPHELLEIEITETSIIDNCDLAIKHIKQFRNAGFNVAIDDFGTGNSSLAYLERLPVSTLKIDQHFIKNLKNTRTATIVKGIIDLAKAMDLGVIAEGVEDQITQAELKKLQCPYAQGHFIGMPAPMENWL